METENSGVLAAQKCCYPDTRDDIRLIPSVVLEAVVLRLIAKYGKLAAARLINGCVQQCGLRGLIKDEG